MCYLFQYLCLQLDVEVAMQTAATLNPLGNKMDVVMMGKKSFVNFYQEASVGIPLIAPTTTTTMLKV